MNFLKKKRRLRSVLVLLLAAVISVLSLAACSGSGKELMSYGEQSLSVNTYEFLLSRMKGTLKVYGYEVDSSAFWNTVVSSDGMTYDEYFRTSVLEQACRYIVAEELFDAEELSLTEEDEENIEKLMDALVENAGSKNALNSELALCGVNYNILKDIYTTEAKIATLKDHLYGENGEKIEESVKEEYYNENYVSFRQIFLPAYYYATETDSDGNTVYYTDEKAQKIAYDTVNGKTEKDEFGQTVKDEFGDPVYYGEDGKIAYDKKNGVEVYLEDEDGNPIVLFYSNEEKGELKDLADKYAQEGKDPAIFDKLVEENKVEEGDGEILYLCSTPGYYGTQNTAAAYLDKITAKLSEMKVGELAAIESDYGYHVVCKYENTPGAYDDEANEEVFESFYNDLITYLFGEKCATYEEDVNIDYSVWEESASFIDIASNTLY